MQKAFLREEGGAAMPCRKDRQQQVSRQRRVYPRPALTSELVDLRTGYANLIPRQASEQAVSDEYNKKKVYRKGRGQQESPSPCEVSTGNGEAVTRT